jgi:hypothetical protein
METMMNALTVIPNHTPPVVRHDMPELERMARAFAASGLFGVKTPEQALALCLIAQAEGKHPALAAKTYHIINGNPSKKSEAMLVDFLAAGGRVEWHELSDAVADATFSHAQGGSVRITWDEKRVSQAQIGGNPMHKKYPRAMKRARCISEGIRTVYPGATGGFYAPEEIQDGGVPMQLAASEPTTVLTGAALLGQANVTATPAADDSTGGNPNAGADAGAAPQDSQADEWAEWAMGALAGIARSDRETLAKWQAKRAPQLAELQAADPKLHGDVMQAIADRNAALDGETA